MDPGQVSLASLAAFSNCSCTLIDGRTFHEKMYKLVRLLDRIENERTIIFVQRKRTADYMAAFLSYAHFNVSKQMVIE